MDQFKLKSIDELDLEFVSKSRGQSPAANQVFSAPQKEANEVSSKTQDISSSGYFSKPAQSLDAEPTYSPQPEKKEKKPRPLVPIGQNNAGYSPVGAPAQQENAPFIPNINYGETEVESAPQKKSKGVLAGKIISIILLAATVVVFVLGCFVSIFLDNGGSNIGGICFNTMSGDLEVVGVSPVSKGDLIISKKLEPGEYVSGDMISVPSATTAGCDIHIINSINPLGLEDAEFVTNDITNSTQMPSSILASDCYGIVKLYAPAIGGLLSFAIENAILVCILFVLLSAFWCLLLVLLEKSGKPSTKEKTKKTQK